ncbi:MAG TPA: phosphoribosylformylglycinamidine synthase, partial [Steroidobacteraceae bacterium]
ERAPYAVIGSIDGTRRLVVHDSQFNNDPVDMPLEVLLGNPPRLTRDARSRAQPSRPLDVGEIQLREAVYRVLHLPAVADKSFLITIGDRTVGGMVSRDQMVGPWQVPVSDVAVTLADYFGYAGEAMAMGERTPLALISAPASGRLAVGEAITNILAADIEALGSIKLSANWMAACGEPGEDAALYATVRAVGEQLCPALGIAIPVGKDSLSMQTRWGEAGEAKAVIAPVSLIVSAFAPVRDARRTLTAQLRRDAGDTELIAIDLGAGRNRLGGSALAQVYGQLGSQAPDVDDPAQLLQFAAALRSLKDERLILAYHDRSDGGLLVTLLEMAFAGHCGLDIELPRERGGALEQLFSEELGAVIQVAATARQRVLELLAQHGLSAHAFAIGRPSGEDTLCIRVGEERLAESWQDLKAAWSDTSHRMRLLRDDPACAREEFDCAIALQDPALTVDLSFDPQEDIAAPYILHGARPLIAILREQGVNSQVETAAVLERAGFEARDVHMTDILEGGLKLAAFKGLVACGGFSYGDVLGAGEGWAKSILFHEGAR